MLSKERWLPSRKVAVKLLVGTPSTRNSRMRIPRVAASCQRMCPSKSVFSSGLSRYSPRLKRSRWSYRLFFLPRLDNRSLEEIAAYSLRCDKKRAQKVRNGKEETGLLVVYRVAAALSAGSGRRQCHSHRPLVYWAYGRFAHSTLEPLLPHGVFTQSFGVA